MLNPWFAITFQAARLGFEAQNAAALQLMRLVGGTSKTHVRGMVADKIVAPPDVPAAAAAPVIQTAATKLASDGARRRESVNKAHKKRSRANKRKRVK
jgi:Na+-transporting methylmalonyl-CoA/oxaloacetate decarboxylase beta subunit